MTGKITTTILAIVVVIALAIVYCSLYTDNAASAATRDYKSARSHALRYKRPLLVYLHMPGCSKCRQWEREIIPLLDTSAYEFTEVDVTKEPQRAAALTSERTVPQLIMFLPSNNGSWLRWKLTPHFNNARQERK